MHKAVIGILGGISLSLVYYYILEVPKRFNTLVGVRLVKPFNCPFCMSFWFSLTFLFFNSEFNLIDCIYLSTITPFLYLFIEEKILSKWEM